MHFCVVFGCKSNSMVDKSVSFFGFPKDQGRLKDWIHYCKRDDFKPTKHSKICSKHFTVQQFSRHPDTLAQLGYPGAKAALKDDAVPDVPIMADKIQPPPTPPTPRGAYEKRRKREVRLFMFFL